MQTSMTNEKLDSVLTNAKSIQFMSTTSTSDFGFESHTYYVDGDNLTYRYVLQELGSQFYPHDGIVSDILRHNNNNSGPYVSGFGGMFGNEQKPEIYYLV